MTAMQRRSRVPAGVPGGGRFVDSTRAEGGLSLDLSPEPVRDRKPPADIAAAAVDEMTERLRHGRRGRSRTCRRGEFHVSVQDLAVREFDGSIPPFGQSGSIDITGHGQHRAFEWGTETTSPRSVSCSDYEQARAAAVAFFVRIADQADHHADLDPPSAGSGVDPATPSREDS